MSDIKRPALISFNAHKSDEKKRCKETGRTVRITLILPESNEDTCPEYNYKEELAAAKAKNKVKPSRPPPTTNGAPDPFGDDDEEVRRIAQEMEARYGSSGTPKRRRKGRRDDYADIGMGYDESDSFIDNTDGYDEIIPQNVTTLHGGFYINSGALEFKTDDEASSKVSSSSSEDEDGDTTAVNTTKSEKKKRVLDTSNSESEGEKETDKDVNHVYKKTKIQTNGVDGEVKHKKKLPTSEKIKQPKEKTTEERKKHMIKDLLGEKLEEEGRPATPKTSSDKEDIKEEPKDSMKENKKPIGMDNITDVIESVIKDKVVQVVAPAEGENSKESDDQKVEFEMVKLPENLPNDIVLVIDKIKELAVNRTIDGKVKFLSGPVGEVLLKLERKCKCLGRQSRMRIYEHLAPFVKCRKETLIKRAKNLVLEDDQARLKELVKRLKMEIDKVMPSLLENYHEKESLRKISMGSLSSEDNKQCRMPKRRFSWNEETKKLLKEIIVLNRRCFLSEGKNKDNLDSLLCTYLKTHIQMLWPEGWMSMTALQKASNIVPHEAKKPPPTVPTSNPQPAIKPTSASPTPTHALDASHVKEIQKLASNSHLSITPVTTFTKPSNQPVDGKGRLVGNDITINKIEGKDLSPSRSILPAEIIKTSNSLTIIPTSSMSSRNPPDRMKRIDFVDTKGDVEQRENHNPHSKEPHKVKEHKSDNSSNKNENTHCQIIDLTDTLSLDSKKEKKHVHSKSRPKDLPEKGLIRVKTDLMKSKPDKEDNLNDLIQQTIVKPSPSLSITSVSSTSTPINSHKAKDNTNQFYPYSTTPPLDYQTYSTTPPLDYQKIKPTTEGDEIQRAMENLKALQRLSSPAKMNETLTSSPVSVIAYNKSYSPKGVLHNAASLPQGASAVPLTKEDYKGDFGLGFQEVFQRQFLNEFTMMQNTANHMNPTTSKGNYNSSEKYPHGADSFLNEKYFQNSNHYPSQNSAKMKNLPQQSGYNNIMDDMLANFFTEYGPSKAGGHNHKQPQK